MSKSCGTCKHWGDPKERHIAPSWADYGVCEKVDTYDSYADYDVKPDVLGIDGSGYVALYFTIKTHHCALFERKDEK